MSFPNPLSMADNILSSLGVGEGEFKGPEEGKPYFIVNVGAKRVCELNGGSTSEGNTVIFWHLNGGGPGGQRSTNQQWTVKKHHSEEKHHISLQSVAATGTGLMGVPEIKEGAKVVFTTQETKDTVWELHHHAGGPHHHFRISSRHHEPKLVFTAGNPTGNAGQDVVELQHEDLENKNQLWKFVDAAEIDALIQTEEFKGLPA